MRVNLHIYVKCPICGRDGLLELRILGNSTLLIVHHKNPNTDHSVGTLNEKTVEDFLKNIGLDVGKLRQLAEIYRELKSIRKE